MFYFYLFRCADGTLYAGCTNDAYKRELRHNNGIGAEWTMQHGEGKIVYMEAYKSLTQARQREIQIKKWSRIKKENLIKGLKP